MAESVDAIVWFKRALLLIVVGLLVQLFCSLRVTPSSFLVFVGVGVGSVGLGLLMFVRALLVARRSGEWRNRS